MKRLFLLTAALTALVATGAAVAHFKSADVSAASATFTATTASHLQTRTVTCAGQSLEISTGRYTGIAASTTTPDLAGPAELKVHSVYNATKKLGFALPGWAFRDRTPSQVRKMGTSRGVMRQWQST